MKDENVNEIKAIVAEIAKTEDGISKHQTGIATLTVTLIVAYYRLGKLLDTLPAATGSLRQARGAWLKRAVELCGNKDRVYQARDVYCYFDDPFHHATRVSGATGEERAKAFSGSLDRLKTLIKESKDGAASQRKREREREAEESEAEETVARQASAPVQGTASRYFVMRGEGEDDEDTEVNLAESVDAPVWPSVEVLVKTAGIDDDSHETRPAVATVPTSAVKENEGNRRAQLASDLIDLCGYDVQQAVLYLIEKHWNMADALKCLEGLVEETTMPDAPASQPDADATDDEIQTQRKKPARSKASGGRKCGSTVLAVAGA